MHKETERWFDFFIFFPPLMLFWSVLIKLIALAVISLPLKEARYKMRRQKQESVDGLNYKYK